MIDSKTITLARSIPIERIINERGIRLRGNIERTGPCPLCGGRDRFAINIKKQVWNCRGCDRGGDVIALVQFLDDRNFLEACEQLTGDHTDNATCKLLKKKYQRQSSIVESEHRQRDKARYLYGSSRAEHAAIWKICELPSTTTPQRVCTVELYALLCQRRGSLATDG